MTEYEYNGTCSQCERKAVFTGGPRGGRCQYCDKWLSVSAKELTRIN